MVMKMKKSNCIAFILPCFGRRINAIQFGVGPPLQAILENNNRSPLCPLQKDLSNVV